MKIVENIAYIAKGNSLKVVDISNKREPKELKSLALSHYSSPLRNIKLNLDKNLAFIQTKDSIFIIDISERDNPVLKDTISIEPNNEFFIKENYLIITKYREIEIFDINDLDNLKKISVENMYSDYYNSTYNNNYIKGDSC